MKSIVTILAATVLCSGGLIQSSMDPRQANRKAETIRAVKDLTFHPLTPVWIALEQDREQTSWTQFTRNNDGKNKLTYNENGGDITIKASMKIKNEIVSAKSYNVDPKTLVFKEIHIKNLDDSSLQIVLNPAKKLSAPKKQKIRAYKSNEADQGEEWEIQITDKNNNEISKSKFKKDTDYKVKKLFVQLNDSVVPKGHPNEKYNWNKVVWVKPDGTEKFLDYIGDGQFKRSDQLEITQEAARFIHKDDQKPSQQ